MDFGLTNEVPLGGSGGPLVSVGAKGCQLTSTRPLRDKYYLITLEACFGMLYYDVVGKPIDLIVTKGELQVRIHKGTAWDIKPRTEREPGNPERVSVYVRETAEEDQEMGLSFKMLNAGEVSAADEQRIANEHIKLREKEIKVTFVPVSPYGILTNDPGWHFSPKEGETCLRGETTCLLVIRTPISEREDKASVHVKAARAQFMDGDNPLWFGRGPIGLLLEKFLGSRLQKTADFSFNMKVMED